MCNNIIKKKNRTTGKFGLGTGEQEMGKGRMRRRKRRSIMWGYHDVFNFFVDSVSFW